MTKSVFLARSIQFRVAALEQERRDAGDAEFRRFLDDPVHALAACEPDAEANPQR